MNRPDTQAESSLAVQATSADRVVARESIFVTADVSPALTAALSAQGLHPLAFDAQTVAATLGHPLTVSDQPAPLCAIIWDDPLQGVAAAILEGTSPEAPLNDWRARAKVLMTLFRRNRCRFLLVDVRTLTTPDAGPEQAMLYNRLDRPDLHLPLAVSERAADALPRILGRLFIAQAEDIQETLEELRASGIAPPADMIGADALSGAAAEFARLAAVSEEVARLRAEADSRAQALQKAAERESVKNAAAKEELRLIQDQFAQQTQELQKTAEAAQRERAAATETIERQRVEIATAQEELELLRAQVVLQAKELQKAVETAGHERAATTETIERQRIEIARGQEKLELLSDQVILQAKELQKAVEAAERESAAATETIERQRVEIATAQEELELLRTQVILQAKELQ